MARSGNKQDCQAATRDNPAVAGQALDYQEQPDILNSRIAYVN